MGSRHRGKQPRRVQIRVQVVPAGERNEKRTAAFLSMVLAEEIEMVKGHVRVGEQHLLRQHELIVQLERDNLPTRVAIDFLQQLEDMQALHRLHLSRLLRKAVDSNPSFTISGHSN